MNVLFLNFTGFLNFKLFNMLLLFNIMHLKTTYMTYNTVILFLIFGIICMQFLIKNLFKIFYYYEILVLVTKNMC